MSSVGQYESPWQIDVASWIIEVVGKVASGVAGAAAASVSPLLAPVVTGALNAISETQSKQLEQLNQIAAAIEAQMEAPYIDGLNKLFDAKRAREETPRQERITKAIESFEVARALAQARVKTSGNERHLFRQAVTEYQIGNCRALLTQLDWASMWYQDAYSTATRYLFAEESPVRPSWNEYQRYSEILQLPPKERNRIAETLQHPPTAVSIKVDPCAIMGG